MAFARCCPRPALPGGGAAAAGQAVLWQPVTHQVVIHDGRATCRRCGRWVDAKNRVQFAARRCQARFLLLGGLVPPGPDWGAVYLCRLGSAGWEERRAGVRPARVPAPAAAGPSILARLLAGPGRRRSRSPRGAPPSPPWRWPWPRLGGSPRPVWGPLGRWAPPFGTWWRPVGLREGSSPCLRRPPLLPWPRPWGFGGRLRVGLPRPPPLRPALRACRLLWARGRVALGGAVALGSLPEWGRALSLWGWGPWPRPGPPPPARRPGGRGGRGASAVPRPGRAP